MDDNDSVGPESEVVCSRSEIAEVVGLRLEGFEGSWQHGGAVGGRFARREERGGHKKREPPGPPLSWADCRPAEHSENEEDHSLIVLEAVGRARNPGWTALP